MASANKSTGLQITLVFTVMGMIIAIVVAFLQHRSYVDVSSNLQAETAKRTSAETGQRKADENLENLKRFAGFPNTSDVGKPESDGDGTVIGDLKKLVATVAPGDLAQPTVSATFQRLGQELDNLRKERDGLNAEATQLKDRVTALDGEYKKLVDAHDKARMDAEKDRSEAQTTKEQAVATKDKEVAELKGKTQTLQTELQTTVAEFTKLNDQSKLRIENLTRINNDLQRAQDAITKVSFEKPSGVIEWVDRDTNLVWINRGQADALRKGTPFSIYKQINEGVARGTQDIKGAVEVTRILGPHQAEARITRSLTFDPIIPGDPIYTPLWHPGRKEQFAFVGLLDLDNDDSSDRDMLHEIVAVSDAVIVDEVDDKGIRHPAGGKIDVGTKFLVVGRIPDFSESRPDDKEAHKLIGKLHADMIKEAQEHGVRIVALHDFLSYLGYEPSRRIWRPGTSQVWNLRQGSRSGSTKPTSRGLPVSSGATSRRFSGNPALPQPESPGQTSKLYQAKPEK